MSIADYKKQINQATTREELRKISYQAMFEKDKTWDKVINLCVKREEELGIS